MNFFLWLWGLITSLDEKFWISTAFVFAATFSGVFLSFWMERRRSRSKEKEEYGRFLQGMLIESANNSAILNNIRNTVTVGATPGFELNTEVLQLAIASPLFYRWADYSLVKAITVVRTNLETINNHLSFYRQAAAGRVGITERGVGELRIRADTSMKIISILQNLLATGMSQFGTAIVKDNSSEEVNKQLAEILRTERAQLEQLP